MGSPTNPTVDRFGRASVPVDYSPANAGNSVQFLFKGVQPPSETYIGRDDQLVIQACSLVGAEVVTVNVRILQPGGRIEENQFVLRPSGTGVTLTTNNALAEGYLLSVSALCSAAITRGQTFARAFLNRGAFGIGAPGQLLFADYLTTAISTGFPGGRFLSPIEGPGFIASAFVTNPGAGADWFVVVQSNVRWRIRSILATLTTNATVANRQVTVFASQGGTKFFVGPAVQNIPAGTVAQVTAMGVSPVVAADTTKVMIPLPPDLILTGTAGFVQTLGVLTGNIQAGDQWSAIQVFVEQWLDNV